MIRHQKCDFQSVFPVGIEFGGFFFEKMNESDDTGKSNNLTSKVRFSIGVACGDRIRGPFFFEKMNKSDDLTSKMRCSIGVSCGDRIRGAFFLRENQ